MCQPKDKGGRRCPIHQPASVALRSLACSMNGLESGQVMHAFRQLRSEAGNAPAPSLKEYKAFVVAHTQAISSLDLPDKDKKRLCEQLNKKLDAHQLPDGATFYALQNLSQRAHFQGAQFAATIQRLSEQTGKTVEQTRAAFSYVYNNPVQFEVGEEDQAASFDARTQAVCDSLLPHDKLDWTKTKECEPISTKQLDHPQIKSIAYYSPDGRHMEVSLWNGKEVVLKNVPPSAARAFARNPNLADLMKWAKTSGMSYASKEEAQRAKISVWCNDCHEYRLPTHTCEQSSREDHNLALMRALERRGTSEATDFDSQLIATEIKARSLSSYEELVEELKADIVRLKQEEDASDIAPYLLGEGRTFNAEVLGVPRDQREKDTSFAHDLDGFIYPCHLSNTIWVHSDFDQTKFSRLVLEEGKQVPLTCFVNGRADDGSCLYSDVTFWAEGERGSIYHEKSALRCTCEAYVRNGRCQHIDGSVNGQERIDAVIEYVHKNTNLASYLDDQCAGRQRAYRSLANFSTREGSASVTTEDGARVFFSGRFPLQGEWVRISEALKTNRHMTLNAGLNHFAFAPYHLQSSDSTIGIALDDEGNISYDWGNYRCESCHEPMDQCRCLRQGRDMTGGEFFASRRQALEKILSASLTGRTSELTDPATTPLGEANARLATLEETFSSTHTIKDSLDIEEGKAPELVGGFIGDVDSYIKHVKEGAQRKKEGRDVADFEVTTDGQVTGGLCAPGEGRYFGLELEYVTERRALDSHSRSRIAQALYDAGLSDINRPTKYHCYYGNKWHIESDCTVSGEVVSPKLEDSPQTWAQVQQVLDIIKANGGKSSISTGGHIHFGLKEDKGARTKVRLHQLQARYRDDIRRIQTDPSLREHRPDRYCIPVDDSAIAEGMRRFTERGDHPSRDDVDTHHSYDLNTEYRKGSRIEMRGRDGALELGHIKTNVAMVAGMVKIAESDEEISTRDDLRSSNIGNGLKLLQAVSGKTRKLPRTNREIEIVDAGFRGFLDRIMPSREAREAGARLAGVNGWQRR